MVRRNPRRVVQPMVLFPVVTFVAQVLVLREQDEEWSAWPMFGISSEDMRVVQTPVDGMKGVHWLVEGE